MVYRVVTQEQSLHEHCCCCWRTWRKNEFACVGPTLSTVSCQFCIRCGHLMGRFSHLWPRHWIALYVQVVYYMVFVFISRTARVTITKYCEFQTYIYTIWYICIYYFFVFAKLSPKKTNAKISQKIVLHRAKGAAQLIWVCFLKKTSLSRSRCLPVWMLFLYCKYLFWFFLVVFLALYLFPNIFGYFE